MGARLTSQERRWRSVPEADLQNSLRQLALTLHVPYFHDRDSRKNDAGLPDTILVVPPVLFLWELKKETEALEPEQEVWGEALRQVTRIDYRVVRPSTMDAATERLKLAWERRA